MATDAVDRTGRGWWRAFVASGVVLLLWHGSGARAQTVCVGDCSGDGVVRVNELVAGVNIALERTDLAACPAFDANGSDAVEVNELVTAVNNTLVGCPMVPSPTPSNTLAPTNTATATATATETLPVVTATATLTVTVGTATPTGTVEEATPTGTVEEATPTPTEGEVTPTVTVTVTVGTSTPTGTVEEATATATATATLTVTVGTATPTGTVTEGTPTHTATPPPSGTPTATGTSTSTPTATNTPTATGTSTSTPTATNTPIIDTVAGVSAVIGNAVTALPNMISSIVNAVQLTGGGFGAGAVGAASGGTDSCALGGTVTQAGDLLNGLTVTLDDCEVTRPGGSAVFDTTPDGTVMIQVNLLGAGNATVDAVITFKNMDGDTTLTTDADLTAALAARLRVPNSGEPCSFDLSILGARVIGGVAMTLNGTLQSQLPDGGMVTVTFQNTMADLTINSYSVDCVPSDYVLVLNGAAQIAQSGGAAQGGASGDVGVSFDVLFDDFTADGEVTGNTTSVDYSGVITAICFGGSATVSTPERVEILLGQFCPADGTIEIEDVGQIFYSNGALSIDTDNDGIPDENYTTCLDPALLMCIG